MKYVFLPVVSLLLLSSAHINVRVQTNSLETIGSVGGWTNYVFPTSDNVFVAQGNTISVMQWSGNSLVRQGFTSLTDEPTVMALTGDRAFTAFGNEIRMVDITNPGSPSSPAGIELGASGSQIRGVFAAENYVYVAQESPGGTSSFWILDVSSGNSFVQMGAADVDGASDVFVIGSTAFLIGHTNTSSMTGLFIFDVSDPTSPTQVSNLLLPGAREIVVLNGMAFVVGGSSEGLSVIDVTDPTSPSLRSKFEGTNTFSRVDAVGSNAYVLDDKAVLGVLDVSDLTNPQRLSTFDPVFEFGFSQSLHVVDNGATRRAYAVGSGTLKVIDVTLPTTPTLIEAFDEPSEVQNMSTNGSVMALVDGNQVWLYTTSADSQTLVTRLDYANSNQVHVGDGLLFAADGVTGLTIWDISDPAVPVKRGSYTAGAIVREMQVRGNYLYVITSDQNGGPAQLEVVDVSSPAVPSNVATMAVPGNSLDLFVTPTATGNEAYIAFFNGTTGTGGVEVIDISTPSSPSVLTTITPSEVKAVAVWVEGTVAAVASMDNSEATWAIQVFDVSNPALPGETASTTGSGSSIWDVVMFSDMTITATFPDDNLIRTFDIASTSKRGGTLYPAGTGTIVYEPRNLDYYGTSNYAYPYVNSGYTTYGSPETSGSKGSKKFRYRITTNTQYTLTTHVQPAEAAADGATVTPSGGTYYDGDELSLHANAPTGWLFTEWSGNLSGSTNPSPLTMDADKDVTANFMPTLTLGQPETQDVIGCPPVVPQEVVIARTKLTASGVDWQLASIEYAVPPGHTGLAAEVKAVTLDVRGQIIEGNVTVVGNGEIGSMAFDLAGVVIAEGETLTLKLVYEFDFNGTPPGSVCPLNNIRTYQVVTSMSQVSALPVPAAARPGIKLTPEELYLSGVTRFACVKNKFKQTFFKSIQEAIDDNRTVNFDDIIVCQGRYTESVIINKLLSVRSNLGPSVTEVRPGTGKAAGGAVFTLTTDGSTLQGFFIRGSDIGVLIDDAANNTIGGEGFFRNVISGNGTGVMIRGYRARNNLIQSNYIGTTTDGRGALGNTGSGVFIDGGSKNIIGFRLDSANTISANGIAGIQLVNADSTLILRNHIGTDPGGTISLGNGGSVVSAGGIVILSGIENSIESNQISANTNYGIFLDTGANRTAVFGNNIGANDEKDTPMGNTSHGIYIRSGENHIGFAMAASRNLIVANGGHGVFVEGNNATKNVIRGNFIGTNVTNVDTLETMGNQGDGIHIKDAPSNNMIVPTGTFENMIAFNKGSGVVITGKTSVGNGIRGNSIFKNKKLQIDLGGDHVTPNDLGDGRRVGLDIDEGPNNLMNFPVGVLATAIPSRPDSMLISGILDYWNADETDVDVFMSSEPDTSGFGGGEFYLGSATPDSTGVFRLRIARSDLTYSYLSATATARADSSTSEFSPVCWDEFDGDPDSDGDGICDQWEYAGVDYDGDGVTDLALDDAPFNAKHDHKDLFVELDYMRSAFRNDQPRQDALDDVVTAFGKSGVTNPDNNTGITLHLMRDEVVTEIDRIKFQGVGARTLHSVKYGNPVRPCGTGANDGHFGTSDDRASVNCAAILGARRLVFRYGLFGGRYDKNPRSGGIAEVPGNDFLVTLGKWTNNDIKWAGGYASGAADAVLPIARRRAEAGTLMHEFGHTLGLRHGGEDNVNCKPNYLSIMNYNLQLMNGVTNRVLDYSSHDTPDLNESALNETVGMGGPANRSNIYNQFGMSGVLGIIRPIVANAVNVDWDGQDTDGDGNSSNDPSTTADLNYIPDSGCSTSGFSTLTSQNDWNQINYSFRHSTGFSSGIEVYDDGDSDPELTQDHVRAIAAIVDFDGDGFANGIDNCSYIPNPTQQDLDGDGIGDICESQASNLMLRIRTFPDPVIVDQAMGYILTVFNAGPDSSTVVLLSDSLDTRLTFNEATPNQGECNWSNGMLTCSLSGLASGDSAWVQVGATTAAVGIVGNWGNVTSMELDPDTTDNSVFLPLFVTQSTGREDEPELPDEFALYQTYPNPFSSTATIPFDVRDAVRVHLVVYNVLGQRVMTLVDGVQDPGRHEVTFEVDGLPMGVYFYRIEMGSYSATRTMVLIR